MTSSLPDEASALLRRSQFARVATVTPDGAPHAAPFWFHWDGERIVVNTLESPTVRNVRADDRVTVLVDAEPVAPGSPSLWISGRARVHSEGTAPPSVRAGSEAVDARHAEEIDTPTFAAYAERETRPVVYLEVFPEDLGWRDAGPPRTGGLVVAASGPPEPVRRMLSEAEVARLATVDEGGQPRLEMLWCRWDGERLVASAPSASAIEDVSARPSVAVLVDLGTRFEDLRGVVLRGRARPVQSTGSGEGAPLEIVCERVSWWDLAKPEGR